MPPVTVTGWARMKTPAPAWSTVSMVPAARTSGSFTVRLTLESRIRLPLSVTPPLVAPSPLPVVMRSRPLAFT